jgi:outer membrane protein OmpA-like peptidoglycan-associated protein
MIKQGIANERLEPKGYGESRPKFSNENAGGRQLNRRVEIKPINAKLPVEVLQE